MVPPALADVADDVVPLADAPTCTGDELQVRRDAIDRLRRLRRQRRVSTIAVLLVGSGNLIAGIWPRWEPRVVQLDERYPTLFGAGHQPLLVASGVALIGLASGLRSAQRRAWAAITLLALVSVLLHATRNFASAPTLLAAALVVWLLLTWRAYTVASRPPRRHGLLAFFALVGMFAVYATVGWHRNRAGLPPRSFIGRVEVLGRCLLGLKPGLEGTTRGARSFLLSLQTVGAILVAAVAIYALQPVLAWRGRRSERALHRFVALNGRTSTAPLAELPDNRIAELDGGDIVLGFKAYAGTAVAVGDPIAVPGRDDAAVSAYVDWCATRGLVPTLLAVSALTARRAEGLGLRTAKIGEDSIVSLVDFSLAGKDRAKLRQAISRAERDGVTVGPYCAADRSHATDAALGGISSEWLATKFGPELGFTLGRFDADRLDEQEVWVARTGERVVAFVTWLPYRNGEAAVLDIMRRSPSAPMGTMELLITRSLQAFAAQGRREVSLGGVPLASTTDRTGQLDQVLGWLFEHGSAVYDAKGLFAFKKKFAPQWEPIYLVFPSTADVPRVALAASRAFFPPGWRGLWGTLRSLRP